MKAAFLATWVVLLSLAAIVIVIRSGIFSTPPLSKRQAGVLIEKRPEFSRWAALSTVDSVWQGSGSRENTSFVDFTFVQKGSGTLVSARSQFNYYHWGWHRSEFWYGQPPHVETVWVGDDDLR